MFELPDPSIAQIVLDDITERARQFFVPRGCVIYPYSKRVRIADRKAMYGPHILRAYTIDCRFDEIILLRGELSADSIMWEEVYRRYNYAEFDPDRFLLQIWDDIQEDRKVPIDTSKFKMIL